MYFVFLGRLYAIDATATRADSVILQLVLFDKTHMHHDRLESRVRLPRKYCSRSAKYAAASASPSSARFL